MEKVVEYLVDTQGQNERLAKRTAQKILKYDDIKSECEQWIDTGKYPSDGVTVEGYNAKKISEIAGFMNGIGVYNFLVTLRDNPEFGLDAIKKGFPRRIIK